MDPWAPISGISLERYAELAAEVEGTQDPEQQVEIVGKLGVARADWDAAKSGWTARMQDMALMGQVATRFMPLYQAALAKKAPGGGPKVRFEDYVAMCGAVPVLGFDRMLEHYRLTTTEWTLIASHWNAIIPTRPEYLQYGLLVEQEAARIRAGGEPRPVDITAGGAAQPSAGIANGQPHHDAYAPAPYPQAAHPQAANPYAQQNAYAQQNPYAQHNAYGQHNAYAQSQQVGAQVGNAFSAFSNAIGSFVDGAIGGFSVGSRVMVAWSDGNRYPGTVAAAHGGQVEVAFPDGRRVWVPQVYVTRAQ